MPRTGENIYKRKDGRWEGRYIKGHTATGKTQYGYLYARTYRELKEKMNYIKNTKSVQSESATQESSILFRGISEDWLLTKKPGIKESTYSKYYNLLNSYIWPYLGDENILLLNYNRLNSFCNELLIRGGERKTGLSAKTVADVLSIVRSILQYASNKMEMPSIYTGKSITVKHDQQSMRVLTKQEQETLCKCLSTSNDRRDLGILVCLFTGLRIGEICALKWGDFSFSEKTLYVHQTMQRIQDQDSSRKSKTRILISTPKSKCSIRIIPLPEELLQLLIHHQCPADAYVLTGNSNRYIEPRNMQNHFKHVIKICSIPDANFHALRHTFATRCVEVGFDIKSLSEILGHASVTITMNRYVHPSMELKRENMNRLSELFAVK